MLTGTLRRLRPVHPCGRREHRKMVHALAYRYGSSLRAQGTRLLRLGDRRVSRFIPAGAGNTKKVLPVIRVLPVHPCGRREHAVVTAPSTSPNGSSLRAQGTQQHWWPRRPYSRFIPAGAGNTACSAVSPAAFTVHPCGRREHLIGHRLDLLHTGSSLRAQGTHQL